MERRRARAARAAPGDIPAGYLDSVAVREYHLEINLAVERRSFSGRVRIPVEIRAGPARRIFYLHAAARLQLTGAKVGGVPGVLFRDRATRIEVPEEAAVPRGASTVIEVCFAGEISNWRTDGLYMGGGKPGVPGKGSGAREEEAQPEAEQRGGGRGGEGERAADASGDGEEAADAAATATAAAAKTSKGTNSDDSDSGPSLVFAPGAVLGTHLEPTHARELFPCVDLPRAKAVFQLTLRGIPAHLQAISNTPVLRTEIDDAATLPAAGDGSRPAPLKSVYFQQTPVMPTYIFGFWVGDFCSVSTRALATTAVCKSDSPSQPQRQPSPSPSPQQPRPSVAACSGRGDTIQINVHVVRGVGLESAEFALDFARRAFELFARLFSVRFPMSKLDLIALPQMNGLGMENFGAITCLQEYLLVTADTSFVRRRRIARLICHEVSHMWYGDIVTPESFDELWLKEGMARFFEYLAVESLDSSYHVWNNFMTEVFVQAMLADSQENSHPVVQQHNGDIASILDSFDTITYCKGASILRMLSHCVGLDRFLRGMGDYVASHQYGCATQEDLWGAVQGVCDQDGVAVNVRDLMQPWLTRPRFPVLRVRMTGNTLSISQEPFSLFAVPEVGAAGGPGSTAAEAAAVRAAGRKGASEAAVARSTKLPRRGGSTAPDDGTSSAPLPADGEPHVGAGSGAAEGAAPGCPVSAEEEGSGVSRPARSNASDPDSEGSDSAGCCWVVPLRVRVGRGPRSGQEGGGREVEGAKLWRSSVSAERSGEVTHSLFLAETQTSVTLHGLSCELAAGPPVAADAGSDVADGDQGRGGKGRPYLVVNDGHSGFFTVQYECERSWGLALAAVEQGVLNECETMGFVHDLMLALHKGVLVDRRAASVSITDLLGGGVNRGRSDCGGVPCLFSRLRELVRLLRRDRSNPAWSTGQLFVWELLAMCASNALGEAFSLSRRQRELSLAQKRAKDSPVPRKGVTGSPTLAPGPSPTGTDGVARAGTGDEGDVSGRTAAECQAGAGSCEDPSSHAQSTDSCSSETTEGNRRATAAVAVAGAAETEAAESRSRTENEMKAAAGRLRSVTAATEVAVAEVGGHVEWHTDRVQLGEEQAEEALQSLRAMKERLERNRAQLAWAKQHELLRAFA